MKKYRDIFGVGVIAIILIASIAFVLVGCNKQLFDTTYSFERAIIYLPDGRVINGAVESWNDYENSDQIQVKVDGKTYLVHSTNVVLISE